MSEKKSYANSRLVVLRLMEILKEKTTAYKPMAIEEMVSELRTYGEQYAANRDTVRRALTDIEQFDSNVKHKRAARTQGGEETTYTYGYWYDHGEGTELERAQKMIQHAIDRIRDSNFRKLYSLSFIFCGYSSNGRPSPAKKTSDEEAVRDNFVPLKMVFAYGNWFVIGYYLASPESLGHIRIDLMKRVEIHGVDSDKTKENRYRANLNRLDDLDEYVHQHPYMSYETDKDSLKSREIKINKWDDRPDASLTFLYDVFGKHWTTVDEDDKSVTVEVFCTKWALEQFVWQNIERIAEMPEEIKTALQEKAKKYFEIKDMREICVQRAL